LQVSPDKVVVELGGTLRWEARGGGCVGVTVRRPRKGRGVLVDVKGGRTLFTKCVLDGSLGDDGEAVVTIGGKGAEVLLEETIIKGSESGWGVVMRNGAKLQIDASVVHENAKGGINDVGGRGKIEFIGDRGRSRIQGGGMSEGWNVVT